MFAFDVSLCEISTLGPMEKCSIHSPSLPFPQQKCVCSASRDFKLLPFLKPTKCWFSSKLMQMFRNWVSNICKCFSLLDKNVWPLKSLGVYCFPKEKVDRTIIQHLLLHWKDWWSLLEGLGDVAGKILWKIYNQDISWHIKKNLNSSVGFYLDFFHLSFFFGISFIGIIWS